jgi:hypothetical protein
MLSSLEKFFEEERTTPLLLDPSPEQVRDFKKKKKIHQ